MNKQSITKILFTILISMMGANAFAYGSIAVENADGVTIYYNYINDDKELEVTVGNYQGNIVIPEEVTFMNRTRKVTSIGDRAFYKCILTSVTIPNSVTSIGYEAFFYCYGLVSATIPNSVTSIGNNAFDGCRDLTSVSIGNSVISIGQGAFGNCSGLTSVTIGNSVTSIGDGAFSGCSGLTSVIIPNSVTSIGGGAFRNCSGLTSVTIGNSVTSIGQGAFNYCSGLTSVIITDVAAWCNIKFVDFESNPLIYAKHLYLNGEEVKDLIIPNSVTSIGSYAFCGCI